MNSPPHFAPGPGPTDRAMSPTALPPTRRARIAALGTPGQLTPGQARTLEAFADTIIPGRKRHPGDDAIAGVSETPGAVEAGALTVLCDPATGIEDGVGEMAELLDVVAAAWARDHDRPTVRDFVDLDYADRRAVVGALTGRDEPQRDLWFLLALFATMAYDSAPHRETADAVADDASGLRAMGYLPATPDGRWAFPDHSYRRPLANLRAGTDARGNLR